jgi:hypothetical protein
MSISLLIALLMLLPQGAPPATMTADVKTLLDRFKQELVFWVSREGTGLFQVRSEPIATTPSICLGV